MACLERVRVAKMMKPVLDKVEAIVGKGENSANKHFLLSQTVFSNDSFT